MQGHRYMHRDIDIWIHTMLNTYAVYRYTYILLLIDRAYHLPCRPCGRARSHPPSGTAAAAHTPRGPRTPPGAGGCACRSRPHWGTRPADTMPTHAHIRGREIPQRDPHIHNCESTCVPIDLYLNPYLYIDRYPLSYASIYKHIYLLSTYLREPKAPLAVAPSPTSKIRFSLARLPSAAAWQSSPAGSGSVRDPPF